MVLKYPTVKTYSAVLSGAGAEPLMLGLMATKADSWSSNGFKIPYC